MKISLATNYKDDLIDQIKDYPVYEIYGKLKNDFVGGGRPDNSLNDIEKEQFEKHVKEVRSAGIRFNYLLNGSCSSNNEQDEEWRNQFIEFLNYLRNIGVNALTVTNPHILKIIKKYFKNDFYIRVSTFAGVDSYAKAKFWEEIGADYICADFTRINRDFYTLKYIQSHLKHAKLEVLATNSCLKNCPMMFTHTSGIAHASSKNNNKRDYEDWCLFDCQKKELFNLDEYIKSPWIRPEDVKYYEKIGIEHIKLTERNFPTEELIKRVKAYTIGKYDGNLLDLIQGHGVVKSDNLKLNRKEVKTSYEIYNEIKRVRGLGVTRECERHIYIDNNKLDKFINFFIEGKCNDNCESCGYCSRIAKNVIKENKEVSNYLKELYNKYDELKI